MIAGAALSAWLADLDLRARSQAATAAMMQRLARYPLIKDLQDELDSMPVKSAATVCAAAERFLSRRGEIEAILHEMIALSAADPFFQPPVVAIVNDVHNAILLFDQPDLSIALGVTGADAVAAKKTGAIGPASISFTGYGSLIHFVKAGGATLSFWGAPEIGLDFHREISGKCVLTGRRRIEDGETLFFDGRSETFVFEHVEGDAVFLQATIRAEAGPLVVEYDSATLDYVGASGTDEATSRLQMMSTLLRIMDRQDAVPLLRQTLDSPHFYARWHIMRELLAMDAEAALPDLRAMAAGDPHPDVRAAAAQTLETFFGEEVACPA